MDIEHRAGWSVRDLLHILFKRKWLILGCLALSVATTVVVARAITPIVFESGSQMLVRPGREHVSDLSLPTAGALSPRLSFDLDEQITRAIELLTRRFMIEQVVREIGVENIYTPPPRLEIPFVDRFLPRAQLGEQSLFERAVGAVQDNLHVERVRNSALINITYRHANPELAARVVNTLGALYLDRHLGVTKDPRTESFFEEQFGAVKSRLTDAESTLGAFKRTNGIDATLKEERELAVKQLTILQTEANEAAAHAAEVSSRLDRLRSQIGRTAMNPEVNSAVRTKLTELELQERELSLRLADRNPTLIALREEIHKMREHLEQLDSKRQYGNGGAKEGSLYARLQEEILRNETELSAVRARRGSIAPELAALKEKVAKLDRIEPEFERLQQRAQVEQQNYKLYLTKSEEVRISNAMDAEKISSVQVIEPARPAARPMDTRFGIKVLMSIVIGLIGGLALAGLLELVGDRLQTVDRVELSLGVPVLASIPVLGRKRG